MRSAGGARRELSGLAWALRLRWGRPAHVGEDVRTGKDRRHGNEERLWRPDRLQLSRHRGFEAWLARAAGGGGATGRGRTHPGRVQEAWRASARTCRTRSAASGEAADIGIRTLGVGMRPSR